MPPCTNNHITFLVLECPIFPFQCKFYENLAPLYVSETVKKKTRKEHEKNN